MENCPICNTKLVQPRGRPRSVFLLASELPDSLAQNMLRVDVLAKEMQRAGIATSACRITSLWLHEPPQGKQNAEIKKLCFDYCLAQLLEQISTAKAVFLMGSELAGLLVGLPVSKINGARVTSKFINPETVLVASYSPSIVLQESGVVGDFRFAVESFANATKELYKEMIHGR